MKYAVVTFGCRVNQADSFAFERKLRAAGGRRVSAEQADLVVVNSCSVTATADHGTRQTIRRIARTNPAARIVATGCYATRDPDKVAELPGVIDVVSNDDKDSTVDRLFEAAQVTTVQRFGGGDGSGGLGNGGGGDEGCGILGIGGGGGEGGGRSGRGGAYVRVSLCVALSAGDGQVCGGTAVLSHGGGAGGFLFFV